MSNASDFIIENGVLMKYKGKGGDIVIPDNVTKIGDEVFRGKKITGVVIPEGVQEIGAFAFQECTKLEKVQLPQSLGMVRKGAFHVCRSLTELIFPDHAQLETIDLTVDYSVRLQHVVFPPNAHFTPRWEGDVQINLEGCSALSDLVCPGVSIDHIAPKRKLAAIQGYICHTEKYVDSEVNQSYNAYLFKQKKNLLPLIWKFDAVHILQILADNGKLAVKTLDAEYLEPATQAKAINCVSFLLDWKNANVTGAKTRKTTKSELDADPYSAGEMKKIWSTKKLEDGTLEITSYKGESLEIEVPPRVGKNPVTRIGEQVFSPYRDNSLTYQKPYERYKVLKTIRSVSIPEGVASIGKYAFAGCSALVEIHIPESATQIGEHAFEKCTALKQIALPAGVKEVSCYLFRECSQLSSVSLPKSVEKIRVGAFFGCCSLEEISLPAELNSIEVNAFTGCDGLAAENQLVVMDQVLHHCHGDAENVVIPDGVKLIAGQAFESCSKLKNLFIPACVIQIGNFGELGNWKDYMFMKCKENLTIHALPNSCGAKYAKTHGITLKYAKDGNISFTGE